jgi:hypothetical protein
MRSPRRGLACPVGVRSGGFPESDLREAGARMLFEGPADLLVHLDRSPFDDRR